MEAVNNWGPAALIMFGYIAASFWQNKQVEGMNKRFEDMGKRFDDMGKHFDDRFEGLKEWAKTEFSRVHDRLDRMEKTLEKLDGRVKVLEDESRSHLVKR